MSRAPREQPDDWTLISGLYHEAYALAPSDRETFLQQACQDEALRSAVRSLLAFADSTGERDVLSVHVPAHAADHVATSAWIRREVAGYRIIGPLGAGGMGVVYKAIDNTLRRPVAIKFLPASGDASARARFLREAQTASSLNHPHILTVYEAGELDGRQYLVTEYVDGGTLRGWARIEPRSQEQVVELLTGVADALATAHDAGIVHRDVKPENILVTSSGYAKLADFGLAKPSAQADATHASDGATVTRTGMVVGTMAYMAPEQALGAPTDARSDVFSFGIVLHELLAGKRPFAGDSALEELQRIVHGTPESLPASVPEALRAIVGRALQKTPAQRYQSMRDVTTDLRAAARTSGGGQAATTAGPRSHRHPFLAPTLAIAAVIVSAAVGFWWRGTAPATLTAVRSLAVLPFKNLSADPAQDYVADGMTESLIDSLAQIRSLRVISRTSVMQFKGTARTIPDIGHALGVERIVESSIERDGPRVRVRARLLDATADSPVWSKEFDASADDLTTLQSDVARAIANEIRPGSTSAATEKATTRKVAPAAQDAYMLGRYLYEKHTKDAYESAMRAFERAISLQPDYATAYAMLAAVWNDAVDRAYLPDGGQGRRAALKALEIDPNNATAQAVVGAQRVTDWDWEGAERAFRRSNQLDPDDTYGCGCFALVLVIIGRSAEGLPLAQHGAAISPMSSSAQSNLGFVLFHMRRFEDAVAPLERAIELEPGNVVARILVSEAYVQLGRHEDAVRVGKEVSDVHLATLYAARPETRHEAEQALQRAERKRIMPGQNWTAGVAYMRLGQKDRAFDYLTKEFDQRGAYIRFARSSPWFDEFRNDPRFDALVRRLHLPN